MKSKLLRPIAWGRLLVAAGLLNAAIVSSPVHADVMDDDLFTIFLIDQLEYRFQDGSDLLVWEGQARIGNDDHSVAFKSEGEYERDDREFETAEFQLLYLTPVSDFFDLQAGVRYDIKPKPDRTYGVVGLNGLAPQWFETDASLFFSERGDASVRLEAEYDLLLTQRLILQPSGEVNIAFSQDEPTDIGKGLSSTELGLRLRYEIEREFAPYVGVNWERMYGETADFSRDGGEDTDTFSLVLGTRMFF